jgi:predicted Zn-dependent protease
MTSQRIPLGLSSDLAEDSKQTLALVNKAMQLTPNDPVVLCYCGSASVFAGHSAQALDFLERSLAINPNNNFTRLAYGASLTANGRPEDGVAQLQFIIRRSPKDPYVGLVYYYLSRGYLIRDNPQNAEQSARNCVKHIPGYAQGHLMLAMSLTRLGRDAEAQTEIQKTHQLEPDLTRQFIEDVWRHTSRNQDNVEKMIALLRQVWRD